MQNCVGNLFLVANFKISIGNHIQDQFFFSTYGSAKYNSILYDHDYSTQWKLIKKFNTQLTILTYFGPLMSISIPCIKYFTYKFNISLIWNLEINHWRAKQDGNSHNIKTFPHHNTCVTIPKSLDPLKHLIHTYLVISLLVFRLDNFELSMKIVHHVVHPLRFERTQLLGPLGHEFL